MAVGAVALGGGSGGADLVAELGQLAPELAQLAQALVDLPEALLDHARDVAARRLATFAWEEGRRQSFYADRTSLPMFRRFAEDYFVEETSPTTSRFTWSIALDPTPVGRVGKPLNTLIVNGLFSDTRRHFPARV